MQIDRRIRVVIRGGGSAASAMWSCNRWRLRTGAYWATDNPGGGPPGAARGSIHHLVEPDLDDG